MLLPLSVPYISEAPGYRQFSGVPFQICLAKLFRRVVDCIGFTMFLSSPICSISTISVYFNFFFFLNLQKFLWALDLPFHKTPGALWSCNSG